MLITSRVAHPEVCQVGEGRRSAGRGRRGHRGSGQLPEVAHHLALRQKIAPIRSVEQGNKDYYLHRVQRKKSYCREVLKALRTLDLS